MFWQSHILVNEMLYSDRLNLFRPSTSDHTQPLNVVQIFLKPSILFSLCTIAPLQLTLRHRIGQYNLCTLSPWLAFDSATCRYEHPHLATGLLQLGIHGSSLVAVKQSKQPIPFSHGLRDPRYESKDAEVGQRPFSSAKAECGSCAVSEGASSIS